ncbi:hypothetical protein SASPL_156682 [Salvia splendens]|uniref:Uncharacterized protein n=1 Tax=Salvia splendens TaxID=180675 RepID=A0A8X8VW79_SALSN|nr:uncharacterized protein LOC121790470 [Salvia splendens]XP_042044610.1 uncharacterized protein LOC121790470 [Salvia splendens]KAG6383560.1 hypothetical protein SASPL_156682 [Salvia splendens]
MGCITSKAITRSMSIREELRHGFQSRSAAWDELLASHIANTNTTTFTPPSIDVADHPPPTNADPFLFTRSKSCHTLREDVSDFKDGKRSLSFHTVEEYDALLERIHRDDVELQGLAEDERCDVDFAEVETGWKRKAVARGLKTLDVSSGKVPAVAWLRRKMVEQAQIYSPGSYVTPKFGSYNAPAIAMPRDNTKQDAAVFSPELLAAFEDCMQQLQVEEDTILKQILVDHSFENEIKHVQHNPLVES